MKIFNGIKNKIREIDKKSPYPIIHKIRMKRAERRLFDSVTKNSKNYLEFGMGGSTFYMLKKTNATIYSVDSSMEWINFMREYVYIRNHEQKGQLHLIFSNIGSTGHWGFPVDDSSKELYPNYSSDVFSKIPKASIDTILIDGRFRVACALQSILQCYTNSNLTILIHDFQREEYQFVLKYLNQVEIAKNLSVFKIKQDLNLEEVAKDYEKYKYFVD